MFLSNVQDICKQSLISSSLHIHISAAATLCLISFSLRICLSTFKLDSQSLSLSLTALKMIRCSRFWHNFRDHDFQTDPTTMTLTTDHDTTWFKHCLETMTLTMALTMALTLALTSGPASQCSVWPWWPPPPSESHSTG